MDSELELEIDLKNLKYKFYNGEEMETQWAIPL